MVKVTIVTVVKDVESTIKRCLSSILNQSYSPIEIIVIDGYSIDNTLLVIRELQAPSIKIYSYESLGIYDALNKGIQLSTGSIIGLLHGDDYLNDENVITRVVEGFENHQVPILIGGLSYFMPQDERKITRKYFPSQFKKWMFRFGMAPPHPSLYLKRELFNKYGTYCTELEIAGDFDLMLRFLYFHNIPFKCLDDLWVMMSEGGKSTNGWKCIIKNNQDILEVCKRRNFYSNYIFIYAKYLVKVIGLIVK